ncbi:uncharacterized protein LOC128875140 isoform X2 [Hylaeus volcanicus]|nr:uncharacterized protein LOC128875140 isoform X2 [Hylaeus volcanicus]XP_053976502.1 uncharacterized protein LOC128875140 isoform X2 [Hylaeus volcanicus]XP_053976509.1 uncharacterized protein LOC128875140 isoform X2 [Hylaeus volcanicus]
MQTSTIQKSRSRGKETNGRKKSRRASSVEEDKHGDVKDEVSKESLKSKKKSEDGRKMFVSSLDPYDVPLQWWETDHVKYAITYPPVKSRLEKVMGTPIVRLTDRKYMEQLSSNIIKDHEEQQKIRIEGRKLSPPSIISELMKISYKALSDMIRQKNYTKLKLYI